MKQYSSWDILKLKKIISKNDLKQIQNEINDIFVDENIYEYVKNIIFMSRENKEIKKYLLYWASPRASIALIKVAKANAFLENRDFVLPEDIKQVVNPILRHRLILNYESLADWINTDFVIDKIISKVKLC
jgi:MoxR-like ATPase